MGHEVTPSASGRIRIHQRELSAAFRRRSGPDANIDDPIPDYMPRLLGPRRRREILIFWTSISISFISLSFKSMAGRTVTTLHGRQDLFLASSHCIWAFRSGRRSRSSMHSGSRCRKPNFVATVHHGFLSDLYAPNFESPRRLCGLPWRHFAQKRPYCRPSGSPRPWWYLLEDWQRRSTVLMRPTSASKSSRCCRGRVEFIGEINERAKATFLKFGASSCFRLTGLNRLGIVMIEAYGSAALRCGLSPRGVVDRRQRSDGPNRTCRRKR